VPTAGVDPTTIKADRAEIASRLAAGYDALDIALTTRQALAAEVDNVAAELAVAVDAHNRATQAHQQALVQAHTAETNAQDSDRAHTKARAHLSAIAVVLYLDPPAELTMSALTGSLHDNLAARSIASARALMVADALDESETTRQRAVAMWSEADRARRSTKAAQSQAKAALDEVTSRHDELVRAHARATARHELLASQLSLGDPASELTDRRTATALATSGNLVPVQLPDGSWSFSTSGLPDQAAVVDIPSTSIKVHTSIAAPVTRLIADARAAGIDLDGSGWRSPNEQIRLRREHCGSSYQDVFLASSSSCSPPTARPGKSLHERGLAIDFHNCATRTTACYRWLATNAHRYGMFNLPSEPWHWSVTGN
jgi:hypothetical protein